jgi:hypothetical protein
MAPGQAEKTRTEVVGVFDDPNSLLEAIDDLLTAGFDRAELSLLADENAVEQKLGHAYHRVEELEDDPSAAREAFVSTEALGDAEGGLIGGLVYVGAVAAAGAVVATGGTLAAVIGAAAAAGGAGAVIGSVLAFPGRTASRRLSSEAAGSRRHSVVGAKLGCRARAARAGDPVEAFRA